MGGSADTSGTRSTLRKSANFRYLPCPLSNVACLCPLQNEKYASSFRFIATPPLPPPPPPSNSNFYDPLTSCSRTTAFNRISARRAFPARFPQPPSSFPQFCLASRSPYSLAILMSPSTMSGAGLHENGLQAQSNPDHRLDSYERHGFDKLELMLSG